MKLISHTRHAKLASVLACVVAISLFILPVQAEESKSVTADEEQLVERIKSEVTRELLESDLLQRQIEIGIEKYVKKQQEAQAQARAEAERLAAEKAKGVRRVMQTRDHVFGNPKAIVSLIEYADYQCAYCARFHHTVKELIEAYEGKVNWVYRHYPLAFHNPAARTKAEAAECAAALGGNEVFWKFTDALFERAGSTGMGFAIAQLTPLAVELGLDKQAFEDCLTGSRFKTRVQEDFNEGRKIGITGTPGSILLHSETGGLKVVSGALPLATLKTAVEGLLDWDIVNVPGVIIQERDSVFVYGKLGKYQITGPLLQAMKRYVGKSVVIRGSNKVKGELEPSWFSEKRNNTLELFVMSMCPNSIDAESSILNFLDTVPETVRPTLDVRYIFSKKNVNGKKTLTALHGEEEVQENLVQMVIRDNYPTIFHDYLLMRIDDATATWQKLVEELGMDDTAKQAIGQIIAEQRDQLIRNEYNYVTGIYKILSSPSYVWESQKVADIRTIELFKDLVFSTTGNCSE